VLPVTLQGAGKWELLFTANLQSPDQRLPITGIEVPSLFTSRYLASGATSDTSPLTWIRAGYLTQFSEDISIDSRFVFPNQAASNTIDLTTKLVKLNAIQLLTFSELAPSYRLFFQPVIWL